MFSFTCNHGLSLFYSEVQLTVMYICCYFSLSFMMNKYDYYNITNVKPSDDFAVLV